jgi:hypothetical protein
MAKNTLALLIIVIVAVPLLWLAFPLRSHLDAIGFDMWIGLLRDKLGTDSPLYLPLSKSYLYLTLTLVPNAVPIIVFVLVGFLIGRFGLLSRWWTMLLLSYGLVLLDFQQVLYDRVVLLPFRLDVLGIMIFFTLSVTRPLWAAAGYLIGRWRRQSQ